MDLMVFADRANIPSGLDEVELVALPFAAVSPGTVRPDGVVRLLPDYPIDRLRLLQGLDWLLTVPCDVVNISVGPAGRFDEDDPLQRASRALADAGKTVVVAAGNDGPSRGTLVALARSPWAVTVGAVDAGGALWNKSARGGDGVRDPDFVSYGEGLDADWFGTSFAAPRVASAAAYAKKCLELIVSDLALARHSPDEEWSQPIDLPWLGFVDTGWDPERAPYRPGPVAADLRSRGENAISLRRSEESRTWARAFAEAVPEELPAVGPDLVRRALTVSARPVEGPADAVGLGFVDWHTVRDTFRELSARTVARLLGLPLPSGDFDRLGMFWDADHTMIAEDAFNTGIRFSVARVAE